ncbi:hypothetical protein BDN72DRAFT_842079 [Pluteus cervinus]|uniref:Uncharacterized protein n=1 Tax=Pluteus cervinus TaxID=181527 RepID=A0ACD3ASH7_9AGAR|nr:hypothetical protein BDN72DRAFT_842079 [Pluteus cervinus]
MPTTQHVEITSLSTSMTSVDDDVTTLNALLAEGGTDLNNETVVELLKRLEGAEGVAQGVEDKLDAILGNLDHLLVSLGDQDGKDVVEVNGRSESAKTEAKAGEGAK